MTGRVGDIYPYDLSQHTLSHAGHLQAARRMRQIIGHLTFEAPRERRPLMQDMSIEAKPQRVLEAMTSSKGATVQAAGWCLKQRRWWRMRLSPIAPGAGQVTPIWCLATDEITTPVLFSTQPHSPDTHILSLARLKSHTIFFAHTPLA